MNSSATPPRSGAPGEAKAPRRKERGVLSLALLALLGGACDGNGTGPRAPDRNMAILAGDEQIGAAGQAASEPLQVVVSDDVTEAPLPGVRVDWSVVEGTGAGLSASFSTTDSGGVASVVLTLGPDSGLYRVRASASRLVTEPPVFRVHAISQGPVLTSVVPGGAAVGDTVTLEGEHFSTVPDENQVLFAGARALVTTATPTSLRAVVPPCLPTRAVSVTVRLGPFASGPAAFDVTGAPPSPLALEVGEGRTFPAGGLDCLELPAGPAGAEYLVVAQNVAQSVGTRLPYQLVGVVGETLPTLVLDAGAAARGADGALTGADWELRLRTRERDLPPSSFIRPRESDAPPLAALRTPTVGEQRTFQVFNKSDRFSSVQAEVMYVSDRAVLYQDVDAPAGGFTSADFESFGRLFDDPIYTKGVAVYGAPSDIDENGRVVILFTPVVNEHTPRDSEGFVAGFFFGLDLTTQSGSNRGEIFYSLVPDPQAVHGDVRRASQILDVVPPVLAHELQHMIHFNQRILVRGATTQETLWLSEGLAHMAEDLVGDVFALRGDTDRAVDFKVGNYARSLFYLRQPDSLGLITMRPPGGLAGRGAAWLFLKHLMGHYGGEGLITRLTQTTRSSIPNVLAETGQGWARLFGDWVLATYADDAPELDGAEVEPHLTYPNVDLREVFGQVQGGFPLNPPVLGFEDFLAVDTLPASSPDYYLVRAGATPQPLNLRFVGGRGEPFPAAADRQISVLRMK